MSLGDISVSLNLDGRDFELGIRNADNLMRLFNSRVDNTDRSIRRNQGALRAWSRQLKDIIFTLGAFPFAVDAVATAIDSTVGSIVRANAQMERLNQLMIGLSTNSTNMAEAQADANKQMDYLFSLADSTPFDINSLTDGMVKFKSAGLDPTNGSFQALVDSVAKFGGTSQQLHRASVAIQQMAGKGVISMEELRQQLGEAVPNAIQTMARGLGTTVANLTKEVSKGIVEANTALTAMFNQMALENSGSAYALSRTWDGLISRLITKWTLFKAEVGKQGAFDEIKKSLEEFLELMDTPAFKEFGVELGQALASIITNLKGATLFLVENADMVKLLGAAWLTYMVASSRAVASANLGVARLRLGYTSLSASSSTFLARDAALRRSLATTNAAMNATSSAALRLALANRSAATSAQLAAHRFTALRAVAATVAVSIRGLGAAIYTALGPVGLLITALWGLYEILTFTSDETKRYNEIANSSALAIDQETLAIKRKVVELAKEEIAKRKAVAEARKENGGKARGGNLAKERLADYEEGTAQLEAQLKVQEDILERSLINVAQIAAKQGSQAFLKEASEKVEEAAFEMRSAFKELDEIREEAGEGMTDEQQRAAADLIINNYKSTVTALYTPAYEAAQESYGALLKVREDLRAVSKSLTEEQKQEIAAQKLMVETYKRELDKIQQIQGTAAMTLLAGQGSGKSPIQKMLESTSQSLARIKAEASGANGALAKFNEQVNQGKFKDATDSEIEAVRRNIVAQHELTRVKKTNIQSSKDFSSIEKTILTQTGRINAELLKVSDGSSNPWLKQTSGMNSLVKAIESGKVKIEEMNLSASQQASHLQKLDDLSRSAFASQRLLDSVNAVKKMKEETTSLNRSLLTEKEQILDTHAQTTAWLDEWLAKIQATGGATDDQIEAFEKYKIALDNNVTRQTQSSVATLLDEWSDLGSAMDDVWKSAMDGMSDALTEFVTTGKLDFDSFLSEIASMIIKAQINKLIAESFGGTSGGGGLTGILGSIATGIAGGLGGAASSSSITAGTTAADYSGAGFDSYISANFANGGIMTEYGRAPLKAYANGGVATSPQLALFGEGSMAEAYVPLPDGRSIPVTMQGGGESQAPNVTVNVLNQSGQQVNAKQKDQKFDGKTLILDVVLEAASKPGEFRSSMRESLK